jgi:hypothetical protein
MDNILNAINFDAIFALPLVINGPGLAIVALLSVRALRCLFSLRLITLFSTLVSIFVLLVLLSTMGPVLALYLEAGGMNAEKSSFHHIPGNLYQRLA